MIPGIDPVDTDAVRWDRYGWTADLEIYSVPNLVVVSLPGTAKIGEGDRLMWPVSPQAAVALGEALTVREGWMPTGLDFSLEEGPRVTVDAVVDATGGGCTLVFDVDGVSRAVVVTREDLQRVADGLNDAAVWSAVEDPSSRSQWTSIASALSFALLAAGALGLSDGFVGAALNALLVNRSLKSSDA